MRYLFLALTALFFWGCTGPQAPPPTSLKPLDQARVTAARVALQGDAEIAPCNLQVMAENDLLVIKGSVPSEAAKKKAEELCRRVEGIEKVANHVQIVPGNASTPAAEL